MSRMKDIAIVTGASGGIGQAISLSLGKQGYRLILLGRDAKKLNALTTECQSLYGEATYFAGDLLDTNYLKLLEKTISSHRKNISALVNNAGIALRGPFYKSSMQEWTKIVNLNVSAALSLSRAVLPGMIDRRKGAIINISSLSGKFTSAGSTLYSATKHALNGLSGGMFEDIREFDIKVSAIMPGYVDTDLTSNIGRNKKRMISPEDVAAAVNFVIQSSPNCCPTEIVLRPQQAP